MFIAVQLMLRNALTAARTLMRLSNETYDLYSRIIDLLSERRAVVIGLGQEIASTSATAVIGADRISVPANAAAATIVMATYRYTFDLIIRDVVVQGSGVTWSIAKTNADNSVSNFDSGRLPLQTNNFTLTLTVAPNGYYQKVAIIQEIII